MSSVFFVLRLTAAWLVTLTLMLVWSGETIGFRVHPGFELAVAAISAWVLLDATSHVRRVRLLTGRRDGEVLSNRQRRELQVPLRGDDAFDELEAAIRALPSLQHVMAARDSLQIRARLGRIDPQDVTRWHPLRWLGNSPTRLRAIVMPGPDNASRLVLSCEPVTGVLADLWFIDDGANVENIEAITRSIARRVSERGRAPKAGDVAAA